MLANRGRSANRQLFFLSLLAQAKGLSRTGMEVFGQMNMCLSPRAFDLELGSFLSRVEERERSRRSALISMVRDPGSTACVCRTVSSGVHVMYFSQFYAVAVQGLGTGAAAECL